MAERNAARVHRYVVCCQGSPMSHTAGTIRWDKKCASFLANGHLESTLATAPRRQRILVIRYTGSLRSRQLFHIFPLSL